MLKTDTDSIITITNPKFTTSCIGCGSKGLNGSGTLGIDITYIIYNSQITYLKNHSVVKIRFYTQEGYIELDVKDRFRDVIKKELSLIN